MGWDLRASLLKYVLKSIEISNLTNTNYVSIKRNKLFNSGSVVVAELLLILCEIIGKSNIVVESPTK